MAVGGSLELLLIVVLLQRETFCTTTEGSGSGGPLDVTSSSSSFQMPSEETTSVTNLSVPTPKLIDYIANETEIKLILNSSTQVERYYIHLEREENEKIDKVFLANSSLVIGSLSPGLKYNIQIISNYKTFNSSIFTTDCYTVPSQPHPYFYRQDENFVIKWNETNASYFLLTSVIHNITHNFTCEKLCSYELGSIQNGSWIDINITAVAGKWSVFWLSNVTTEPSNPKNCTVTAVSERRMNISWIKGIGGVDKFYLNGSNASEVISEEANTTKYSLTITKLRPAWKYKFSIVASMNNKNSSYCIVQSYTRPSVQDMKVNIGTKSATFSWENKLLNCSYYFIKIENEEFNITWQNETDCMANVSTLTPWKSYNVSLWANLGGSYTELNHTIVNTLESSPGVPTNLYVNNTLYLSWTKPEDPNGVILYYKIFVKTKQLYSTENWTNLFVHNSSDTTSLLNSSKPGICYGVAISAVNNAGEGNKTKFKYIRTKEEEPDPVSLTIINITSSSVTVRFNRPESPNGIILQYLSYLISGVDTCYLIVNCSYSHAEKCNSSKSEENFHVNFKKNSDSCNATVSTKENARTWIETFSNLYPYTNYTIEVTACNFVGCGKNASLSVYTNQSVPGNLSNLNATVLNSTAIYLSWNINSLEKHGVITNFIIYYESNNKIENHTVFANTTEKTIEKLQKATNYTFSVQACNAKGCGPKMMVKMKTCDDTPEEPSHFNASMVLNTSHVVLTWKAPTPFSGKILEYFIEWKICNASSSTGNLNVTSGDETQVYSKTIDSLEYWTCYNFEISAATSKGKGKSTSCNVTTDENVPTSPVYNVTNVSVSSTTISLTWKEPLKKNGIITKYRIQYTFNNHVCNESQDVRSVSKFSNNTSYNLSELFAYWEYKFEIFASTIKGEGKNASEIHVVETNESVPDNIEKIQFLNVTNSSVLVQWNKPCLPNGHITNYTIWISDANKSEIVNETKKLFQNLLPYKNYTISIKASTSKGSGNSTYKKVATHIGVPFNVSNITGVAISATAINISWHHPNYKTGPTNYSVNASEMNVNQMSILHSCTTTGFAMTHCIINGLEEYWNYTFTVTAITSAGSRMAALPGTVQTDESIPGLVRNLTVTRKKDVYTTVELNWQAPSEREKNGIIQFYTIEYKLNKNMKVYNKTDVVTELHVIPEYNYNFWVAAVTSKGRGNLTNTSIEIPAGPPPKPKEIIKVSSDVTVENKRQIAIALPMEFFRNEMNGKAKEWGLIVAEAKKAKKDTSFRGSKSDFMNKQYKSWKEVHDDDVIDPYRATQTEWSPFDKEPKKITDRKKRSIHQRDYIVGEQKYCAGFKGKYCNGYLEPGREYKVKAFMCTSAGCTETDYSLTIHTEDDLTVVYVSVTVVMVIVLVSSISAAFFLYKKQMYCFKRSQSSAYLDNNEGGQVNLGLVLDTEPRTKPIKLSQFHSYLQRMQRDSNLLFSDEYKKLKLLSPDHSHNSAELQENRTKNRYTNILAFDHSRVKLLPLDDEEGSDYINANYMPGYNSKREYIAAQGPLPSTKDDFWRLIWEQNVSIVVMVTQCVERGRVKCEQYWPSGSEPVYFGDLIIQLRSESILPDYILRILDVKLGEKKREVKHFHFLKWPDFGCPENTGLLINFVRTVRSYMPYTSTGPSVVHCSAGVGRTGTFICVDRLLQHIHDHDEVDIFGLVLEIRNFRTQMVQTEDQYVFIHQCIADFLSWNDQDEDIYINDTAM